MQTATLLGAVLLVTVMLLTTPQAADAVCCPDSDRILHACGDCTTPTPYCGHGPCNIFGCNCSGGCRRGRCERKRSADYEIDSAESIVSAGDLNGDGLLSIDEAETMLQKRPNAAHRRSVRSLDKDMDGMLSVDEIDN